MTTRKPLLSDEEIKRYTITGSWENNGLYHCEEDSLGGWVRFADHLADRDRLLAEIERLEAMVPRWVDESEHARLLALGWHSGPDAIWYRPIGAIEAEWHYLMAPPIPLPETRGGNE